MLLPLKDIYKRIIKIEGYFNSMAAISLVIKIQPREPIYRYS